MSFLKRIFSKAASSEELQLFALRFMGYTGNFMTMCFDGRTYATQRGIRMDDSELVAFLEFASHFGDPIALCAMGDLYAGGKLRTVDFDRAEYFYRLAYEQGDLPALHSLAAVAVRNHCSRTKLQELRNLLESELPQATAICNVLSISKRGKTLFDLREGLLFRIAVSGDKEAQFELAKHWHQTRKSWAHQDNPNAQARANMVRELAEAAARQTSVEAQWLLVEILSLENGNPTEKSLRGQGVISPDQLARDACEQSLMWAVLASMNHSAEIFPGGMPVSELADNYIRLAEQYHGTELITRAQRAASNIEYAETLMTRCTRTTKSLLAANAGVFPKNWAELVELPMFAPRITM